MQNCKHETKQNKSRFLSNDRWAWYGRDVPTNVASNIIPGLQTDLILLTESLCGVFLLHLTVIIDPAGLLRTQTYTCDMIEACSVVKKCDLSLTLWRRSDQRYCSLIRFPSAIWQSMAGGTDQLTTTPQTCASRVMWPEQLNAHAPLGHIMTMVLSRGVSVKIGVSWSELFATVISRPSTT